MQHDAVRDGRHLMAQDCVVFDDPLVGAVMTDRGARLRQAASVLSFHRAAEMQAAINRAESERLEAIEHPNYRYPQERTGDSTV